MNFRETSRNKPSTSKQIKRYRIRASQRIQSLWKNSSYVIIPVQGKFFQFHKFYNWTQNIHFTLFDAQKSRIGTNVLVQNESKDCLFVLTDRCYACILEYNDGKIITRAYGDMKDKNFQTSSLGVHAAIDPGTYPSYCPSVCPSLHHERIIYICLFRVTDSCSAVI